MQDVIPVIKNKMQFIDLTEYNPDADIRKDPETNAPYSINYSCLESNELETESITFHFQNN